MLTSYLAFHPAVYLGILSDIYSHILSCILSRTVFGSGEPQKARERAFRDPLLAGETSPQDLEIRMDTGRPQGPFFNVGKSMSCLPPIFLGMVYTCLYHLW